MISFPEIAASPRPLIRGGRTRGALGHGVSQRGGHIKSECLREAIKRAINGRRRMRRNRSCVTLPPIATEGKSQISISQLLVQLGLLYDKKLPLLSSGGFIFNYQCTTSIECVVLTRPQ